MFFIVLFDAIISLSVQAFILIDLVAEFISFLELQESFHLLQIRKNRKENP